MTHAISFAIGILASIAAAYIMRFSANKLVFRFSFRRVMQDIKRLQEHLKKDRYEPDYIVTVDRNASIVGGILSGYLGLTSIITVATINERKPDGTRSISLSQIHLPDPEGLKNKKILLLGWICLTGGSLNKVYQKLSEPPYEVAEIRLATLYTSTSPVLKPKYYAREMGRDIGAFDKIISKMPWMTKEWGFPLAEERINTG